MTPFQFADGVYYRLGKKLTKKELGITLKCCKDILDTFHSNNWQDYEIMALVDNMVYDMRRHQIPLHFRLFYTILTRYLSSNLYASQEDQTQAQYRDWIEAEIARLKAS